MSDKMQTYYDSFVKGAIKSKEHFESFCKSADITRKFTTDELSKLKKLWAGTSIEKTADKAVEAVVKASEGVFKDLPTKKFDIAKQLKRK